MQEKSVQSVKLYAKKSVLPHLKKVFPDAKLSNAYEFLASQSGFTGWRAYRDYLQSNVRQSGDFEVADPEAVMLGQLLHPYVDLALEYLTDTYLFTNDPLDAEAAISKLFNSEVINVPFDAAAQIVRLSTTDTRNLRGCFQDIGEGNQRSIVLDCIKDGRKYSATKHRVISDANYIVAIEILSRFGHTPEDVFEQFMDYAVGCLYDYVEMVDYDEERFEDDEDYIGYRLRCPLKDHFGELTASGMEDDIDQMVQNYFQYYEHSRLELCEMLNAFFLGDVFNVDAFMETRIRHERTKMPDGTLRVRPLGGVGSHTK